MRIDKKIDKYLVEAVNKTILKANIKKRINKDITNLTTPKNKTKYFDKIPLQPIFDILKKYNIVVLQEDNTEWDGFLVGRSETVDFVLAPSDSKENNMYTPFTNASLRLQWYKMESGRYEITSYVG
jgi:hypothetical protein